MAVATKEMERKALEKIRKIVTDLGEDSYIGRAFEGCFEIAEGNIDNDFWNSMKDWAEHFESERDLYKQRVSEIAEERRIAVDGLISDLQASQAEVEKLRWELQLKVIDEDDLKEVIMIVSKEAERMEAAVREEAENIVIYADRPDSESFKTAVTNHRLAEKNASQYDDLVNSLEAALGNY